MPRGPKGGKRPADVNARAVMLARRKSTAASPEPTRYGDWEIKGLTSDF